MDQFFEFMKKMEVKADRLRAAAFKVKAQPMSEFGTPYGGFQRRLLAATVDTVIITLTIVPLSYWLTDITVGEVDLNILPLLSTLQQVQDPLVRSGIIKQFLIDEGRLDYIYANSMWQLVGCFIYCMVCWKKWAATPGKMVLRLQVLEEDTGKHLTYIQGFWRCVGYVLGTIPLCLGTIWISISKRRQGWHDLFARSVVIVKAKDGGAQK